MKSFSVLLLVVGAMFAQTPAAQKKAAPATPAPAQKKASTPPAPQRDPGLYATFNTSMGQIVAVLYEKEAPVTVQNFVALARGTKPWKDPKTGQVAAKKLYDGVTFHRVIPDFMIQTGDPTGTGSHDCGFTIKDEIVPGLRFDRPGRLGMANVGAPNSGGCQFFITEVAKPHLDPGPNGAYTIFGQVIEGQEHVSEIARVPRDGNDKPRTPVILKSVVIQRVGPPPAPAPAATKKGTSTAPAAAKKAAPATTTPAPAKK